MNIVETKQSWIAKDSITSDEVDYISKVIDIYSAVTVSRNLWLTDREKAFYVALVILNKRGIHFKAEEALPIFNNMISIKRPQDIIGYTNRLAEKRWIKKRKWDIELPPIFGKLKEKFIFNIEINEEGSMVG